MILTDMIFTFTNFNIYIIFIIIAVVVPVIRTETRDIVFVLDRSGSVSNEDFNEAVDFVYNITKWLNIGSSTNNLLISIVTYSNTIVEEFDLDDYTSKTNLLTAIEGVKSRTTGGTTYTHEALQYCDQTSFTSSHGSRSGVPKAVVVLTDGISTYQSQTLTQASNLQNAGIEVYAIGIGSVVTTSNAELQAIASDPDSYYLNTIGTFSNLCLLVPELVPKLDEDVLTSGIDTCGSFNTTDTTTDASTSTDNTAMIAGIASAVALAGIAGAGIGIAKALALMKVNAVSPTILAAVNMFGPAELGQAKAKFTTKFEKSGMPMMGEIITSKAPAQTFNTPRSIASVIVMD